MQSPAIEGATCPATANLPVVSVARRADQLAQFFADHHGKFSVGQVPPIDDGVARQLNRTGMAVYDCFAARAVDFAHFAVYMQEAEPSQEIHRTMAASRDADFLEVDVDVPDDVAERMGVLIEFFRPARATLCFSQILGASARDFVANRSGDLAKLRQYEHAMYQAAGDHIPSGTLTDSYRPGINTLSTVTNRLLNFYYDDKTPDFSQPATQVVRNSVQARRKLAASTRSLNETLSLVSPEQFNDKLLKAVTSTDEERIDVSKSGINNMIKIFRLQAAANGRTDNACPAIAPIPSIAPKSAIELLNDKQIDEMEAVEAWPS